MKKQADDPRSRKLRTVIIILAVLLVISAGGLAARIIYLNFIAPGQETVTVPDNLLVENNTPTEDADDSDSDVEGQALDKDQGYHTPTQHDGTGEEADVLELYSRNPGVNEKFSVYDMLPGDNVTGYFCVRINHEADIELFFSSHITEMTKDLGKVLNIRITSMNTGDVIWDGPFSEADDKEFSRLFTADGSGQTLAYYKIDVYLDTSVGNEYQNAELKADFRWYVKEDGKLTPPKTGDSYDLEIMAAVAAVSFILLMIFAARLRKETDSGKDR